MPLTRRLSPVIGIAYTRRCPLSCAHCIASSSPRAGETLPLATALAYTGVIARSTRVLCLTGGEPMLCRDEVLAVAAHARGLGLRVTMVTNAFWAPTDHAARDAARAMARSGIGRLCVSWDRYHGDFLPVASARRAAAAALGEGIRVVVRTVRGEGGEDRCRPVLDGLDVEWECMDLVCMGRAETLPADRFATAVAGESQACQWARCPVIEPDGRVFACYGRDRLLAPGSPLDLGDATREPLEAILARAEADPVLEALAQEGPSGLCRVLREEGAPFPGDGRRYPSRCNLCLAATNDGAAVSRLRRALPRRLRIREAARALACLQTT